MDFGTYETILNVSQLFFQTAFWKNSLFKFQSLIPLQFFPCYYSIETLLISILVSFLIFKFSMCVHYITILCQSSPFLLGNGNRAMYLHVKFSNSQCPSGGRVAIADLRKTGIWSTCCLHDSAQNNHPSFQRYASSSS